MPEEVLVPITGADRFYQASMALLFHLQRAVPRAKPREARRYAWISAETWRLIDERVSVRRDPRYRTVYTRWMGKAEQTVLAADRRRRADIVGAEVEALVNLEP